MDLSENVRKFACLLAELNKEGLDTKLIELGQGLIPKLGDDEILALEDDCQKVKCLFKNYQEENLDFPNTSQIQLKEKPTVRAYVDGCYDLIHAGHYNAFRQSHKLGDILVCGVNSDSEVTSVKGPPIFNNDERWAIVAACKWVDEVEADTEYTPTVETLNRYDWDFYVHGDDVALNSDGIDSSHELKAVGRFKMFKRTRGVSTTDIASKLLSIDESIFDHKGLEMVEEEKDNLEPTDLNSQSKIPTLLGSFNANPYFLASAKRIANFASIKEPLESDKIVYVDGSWDICHPGHIELLKKAKERGDYLIVGVHEDEWVNQYLGSSYPLNTLHERVLNILAWKYVDDVIIGAPFKITERLLRDLNVSVIVKSLDFIQGGIKSCALDLKPYEVPNTKDIISEVEIESTLTLKEIARRVGSNREAIAKKVLMSIVKQKAFEENAKFFPEVR